MKFISGILFILSIGLILLSLYANYYGLSKCNQKGGNWVKMNGGLHCVDNSFNKIDIYK